MRLLTKAWGIEVSDDASYRGISLLSIMGKMNVSCVTNKELDYVWRVGGRPKGNGGKFC